MRNILSTSHYCKTVWYLNYIMKNQVLKARDVLRMPKMCFFLLLRHQEIRDSIFNFWNEIVD